MQAFCQNSHLLLLRIQFDPDWNGLLEYQTYYALLVSIWNEMYGDGEQGSQALNHSYVE